MVGMKRIAAVLLAILLAAALPAALAAVEDDPHYVEKFTLADGTELSTKVAYKAEWEYVRWGNTEVAQDIPVYTVTVPEGAENVRIYFTEEGTEVFCGSDTGSALYTLVYDVEKDTTDEANYTQPVNPEDEDHFVATVTFDKGYVLQKRDGCDAAAILVFEVGDLPAPDQPISGDVNGDKSVDVNDAIAILRHVAWLEAITGDALTAADVNGDQAVDVNDAIVILKQIAGTN